MNVRIRSGGTYSGSSIENAETGEVIKHVTSADIHIYPTRVTATLRIDKPEMDITCEARIDNEPRTLVYDPDDIDSIDKAITLLADRREALTQR